MEWLVANVDWVFSGIGVTVLVIIFNYWNSKNKEQTQQPKQTQQVQQTQSLTIKMGVGPDNPSIPSEPSLPQISIEELKKTKSILFIDDDKTFKIVDILKRMGWVNTKLIKDINSLSDPNVQAADVLFIDIQGVGKLLQQKDEGLGLALAIKRRFSGKKVVIYSAQEDGARFHEALSEADYSLPKTAEPIRFEETIIRVLSK